MNLLYNSPDRWRNVCCFSTILLFAQISTTSSDKWENVFKKPGVYDKIYGSFDEGERLEMLALARETFTFAYDSYMEHAFPADELNPLYCSGRGPDHENPSNININDVLGNFSLTLVDTLDTLAVMGNHSEFKRAVKLVIENVTFDNDQIVQVFEVTIRIIGGLLSAHLLIINDNQHFGNLRPEGYKDELLYLARDLAVRLLPAFETSTTGLPFPRVHLREGVPNSTVCPWCRTETCPAGAGSLLLEFGVLSRLLGDARFELAAKKAIQSLWNARAKTGLLGNAIDSSTGEWIGEIAGVGAGIDSFYEYLLKSWIMFGDKIYLRMFEESYRDLKTHARRGRAECNLGIGTPPMYLNVNMNTGKTQTLWIDSLGAAWSAVQLLAGDLEEAICSHMLYFNIWRRFDFLPERFNLHLSDVDIAYNPNRPELAESTYLLYEATRNPFYLHVGKLLLQSINKHTRTKCGYATIHDVREKSLEDRMESFFLGETCKYLYLLFDRDNPLSKHSTHYIFTTEGHIFPLSGKWQESSPLSGFDIASNSSFAASTNCDQMNNERRYLLPLREQYFAQLSHAIGSDS